MRSFSLVILVVWLFLGYLFHQQQMKCCSADSVGSTSQVVEETKTETGSTAAVTTNNDVGKTVAASGPILYNYSNSEAILGDGWSSFKSQLLGDLKDKDIMEITGFYTSDEKAPVGFANMGEARAEEARVALGVSKDRVLLKGQLSNQGVDKEAPYVATSFKNLGAPKSIDESIDNKTIIRFPYNSTNKLSDKTVETYLNKVASRVKASGERVRLTGHTDSDGSSESNQLLGQRRADIIKNYLVNRGVSASKIITASKGEMNPISSNSTKAGMAENRRTELEIIK